MEAWFSQIISFLQNPIVLCVATLTSILGLPLAIFLYYKGKKWTELSCCYELTPIIESSMKSVDGVIVSCNGEQVDELFEVTFYIWNSGTEVITSDKLEFLDIILNGNCKVLSAEIVAITSPENLFDCSIKELDKNVQVNFDYMNTGDGVKIKVICSGNPEFVPLWHPLKGGRFYEQNSIQTLAELLKKAGKHIMVTIAPLFGVMLLYCLHSEAFLIKDLVIFLTVFVLPVLVVNIVSIVNKKCKHRIVPRKLCHRIGKFSAFRY